MTTHRGWRDEHGAVVSAWALLTITVMTVVIGIATDLASQLTSLRHASDVASQAARSAAQQVATDTYLSDGHSIEVSAGRARTAALTYVNASGMTGSARIADGNLIVDTTAHYRPRFLSIIGIGSLQVTGTATVRIARALNGEEHP